MATKFSEHLSMVADFKPGDRVTYRGEAWRVIDVDSDPNTQIHIVNVANPDKDAFVMRRELQR